MPDKEGVSRLSAAYVTPNFDLLPALRNAMAIRHDDLKRMQNQDRPKNDSDILSDLRYGRSYHQLIACRLDDITKPVESPPPPNLAHGLIVCVFTLKEMEDCEKSETDDEEANLLDKSGDDSSEDEQYEDDFEEERDSLAKPPPSFTKKTKTIENLRQVEEGEDDKDWSNQDEENPMEEESEHEQEKEGQRVLLAQRISDVEHDNDINEQDDIAMDLNALALMSPSSKQIRLSGRASVRYGSMEFFNQDRLLPGSPDMNRLSGYGSADDDHSQGASNKYTYTQTRTNLHLRVQEHEH